MKTSLENVSNLNRRLSVELPPETVKSAFDKAYRDVQRDVTIKGFRKGKAPIAAIRNMYHNEITQDVVRNLIGSHFYLALKEHDIYPLGTPDFEYEDPSELSGFTFTAAFDIRPEVTLKKYEGLEVEKEKFIVDEGKVDATLENIRKSRATLKDLSEPRPAKMGDTTIIDFEGTFADNQPLENGNAQDFQLELGSARLIPGFEEGIVGMSVGEQKTLNLEFPTSYHVQDLAGKQVNFKVTLKAIKEKELPILNEEFFQNWGGPKSLEELKNSIRQDMEETEKKRIEDEFRNKLIKALVKLNPLEVPESLKRDQKSRLIEDFVKRMKEQNMEQSFMDEYIAKWDSEFDETAAEMIQASFLIDAIASKHDLHCNEKDIEQRYSEYAQKTGLEEAKIREFYSAPEKQNHLSYLITEEKVVKFLTNTAKVKEIAPKTAEIDNNL